MPKLDRGSVENSVYCCGCSLLMQCAWSACGRRRAGRSPSSCLAQPQPRPKATTNAAPDATRRPFVYPYIPITRLAHAVCGVDGRREGIRGVAILYSFPMLLQSSAGLRAAPPLRNAGAGRSPAAALLGVRTAPARAVERVGLRAPQPLRALARRDLRRGVTARERVVAVRAVAAKCAQAESEEVSAESHASLSCSNLVSLRELLPCASTAARGSSRTSPFQGGLQNHSGLPAPRMARASTSRCSRRGRRT